MRIKGRIRVTTIRLRNVITHSHYITRNARCEGISDRSFICAAAGERLHHYTLHAPQIKIRLSNLHLLCCLRLRYRVTLGPPVLDD